MEPCIVAGKLRVWRGMRKNGEDKLVWEFENCENGRNKSTFDLESWCESYWGWYEAQEMVR